MGDLNQDKVDAVDRPEDAAVFSMINQTNDFLRVIDFEIMTVHKTARDGFLVRFPELESIILNPVDYCKAVLAIGNQTEV